MQEFDKVYRQYSKKVYRFILRLSGNPDLAADITQDTFMQAIRKSDTFKGNCAVDTWLCSIARNLYINAVKKRDNRNQSTEGFDVPDTVCIESMFENQEQMILIHKSMHTLSEPYKEVFSLRVMGELSFSEIGIIFEKNENWARVTFFRAKTKLIEKLREDGLI